MSEQQEPRLCPFCGTYTAKAYHAEAPHDDWFVKCSTCNNSMPPTNEMVHSEAEAIAAWMGSYFFRRIDELEQQLASVTPSDEAISWLREMVRSYRPEWHYEMGKTGYECSYCNSVIRSSGDFWKPDNHAKRCTLIKAASWLAAQGTGGEVDDANTRS